MTSTRKSLVSGIFYTAIAKYSGIIISIVIGAVLARLLTPEEFGIVALVTVFVSFFNLLSDFGLGPAVVQNQSLDENDIESIFLFSIILAFTLSVIFFLGAPLIARFYNEPVLVNVSRYLSLSILLQSLQIVPRALFQKNLKFKQIGLITVSVQLFSGMIAIFLALKGFSYYALVFQSVLSGGITLIIYYFFRPIKLTKNIGFESLKKILRFSSFQFLFNFINYFSRNADSILIGKYLGTAPLGFYDKSYRLMLMPVQNLTHVITPVLMPVLSRFENDKNYIFNSYLKIVRLLAVLGFPLSVFLYFTANEIILILFGPQWIQSVPVFKILALSVGIQIILSSCGSIFQTVNRTDLLFISGLLSAILMLGGIGYGIFIGKDLESIGYGLFFAFLINFIQSYFILIKNALKSSLFTFYRVLLYPFLIALVLFLILTRFDGIKIENLYYSFLIKLAVTAIVFFLLIIANKRYRILVFNIFIKTKKR